MERLLDLAKQKNAQLEIYKLDSTSNSIEIRNKKVETIDSSSEKSISLRVIIDNKLGFAYSTDFDESALEDLLDQAIKSAKYTVADPNNVLAKPQSFEPLVTYDRDISNLKVQNKIELALKMESAAYAKDKRVKATERVTFSDAETKVEILSSTGIKASYNTNHCGGSCDVIAETDIEKESGSAINYVSRYSDFNANDVGAEAAERACELLSAKTIPAQKINLILDQYVGAQLLGSVSSIFSSNAIQKGKSLLIGKLEKEVASGVVTLIDDGRLKNGLMSSPIDDEGIPTQKTILIENGILKNYLYNMYTGTKENKKSTGNGRKMSYKSLPEVSPSNFYIKPGDVKPNDIIAKTTKGIYITRVMGIHTINQISGDFSIGAAGVMVENGVKTHSVRGITIAGNLVDLLKSIQVVGSDIRFFPFSANFGSPTLLVADIAVSG